MQGKSQYSTLNQFDKTHTGFDIREDEEKASQQNRNMAFTAQIGWGRGNNNFNSR